MENLVVVVKHLVVFAISFPQTSYDGLMVLLQREWKFF